MASPKYKIPQALKLSILRRIGFQWSDAQIVKWLEAQGIQVSRSNIYQNYRNNPAYQDKISRFARQFEEGVENEPLQSKRHVLDRLHSSIESATSAGDYRQISALLSQALNLVRL